MTVVAGPETTSASPRRRRVGRGTLLVFAVIVVPFTLAVAFNSWGPMTTESVWRMAAAAVAGQTIAILTAIVAVVLTAKRGDGIPAIVAMVVFAAAVTAMATNTVGRQRGVERAQSSRSERASAEISFEPDRSTT